MRLTGGAASPRALRNSPERDGATVVFLHIEVEWHNTERFLQRFRLGLKRGDQVAAIAARTDSTPRANSAMMITKIPPAPSGAGCEAIPDNRLASAFVREQ